MSYKMSIKRLIKEAVSEVYGDQFIVCVISKIINSISEGLIKGIKLKISKDERWKDYQINPNISILENAIEEYTEDVKIVFDDFIKMIITERKNIADVIIDYRIDGSVKQGWNDNKYTYNDYQEGYTEAQLIDELKAYQIIVNKQD